jgi:hypothetical protein
MSSEDLY